MRQSSFKILLSSCRYFVVLFLRFFGCGLVGSGGVCGANGYGGSDTAAAAALGDAVTHSLIATAEGLNLSFKEMCLEHIARS